MTTLSDQEQLAQALRNPGRLVLGPTTTSGSFPFGGTPLGSHVDGSVVWHTSYMPARDPASGRVTEVARRDCDWPEIYALLEGMNWDEDVLKTLFAARALPSSLAFGDPVEVRIQGTNYISRCGVWPPLLFSANDPQQKSVYLTRPIPILSLHQSVAIASTMRAGLPIRVIPTPASDSTPDWQVARMENITL